jgi:hypothetical protein
MNRHNTFLSSIGLFIILGISLGACSKALKGCGKASEKVAERADDLERAAAQSATRAADEAAREAEAMKQLYAEEARKAEDAKRSNSFKQNSSDNYSYDNKQYGRFKDVPFQSTDNLYFDHAPTQEEAAYLIEKGVKFVYNNPAYLKQKDKPFRIIYLISDDVNLVKDLYELDDAHAQELIKYSSKLPTNYTIFKVSSYGEMLAKQDEVLSGNEIPVLIFHNSVKQRTLTQFNPEANFITCNSFELNAKSYLTSIDLLDMQAIIEAVNSSHSALTLEGFYNKFTAAYHSHMSAYHQQNTLIYLGGGIVVSAGVYAIAYYNKKT